MGCSCHAWCYNTVYFDRFAGWKLRTDSNSPSSWKGFIQRGTTKPSDARKHKPHRPWNIPFCHKDSSFALSKQQDQEHELRDSEKIIWLFFVGCFTRVSLEFPSREGRCTQRWNYVAISIYHESFGINHKRLFFFLSRWKYTVFPMFDYVWLTWSPGRMKAERLIKYQNITQKHWLTFTVQSLISYLTNFSCENSTAI